MLPAGSLMIAALAIGACSQSKPLPRAAPPTSTTSVAALSPANSADPPSRALPRGHAERSLAGARLAIDRGPFPEYNDQVELRLPEWLKVGPVEVMVDAKTQARWLSVAGEPFLEASSMSGPVIELRDLRAMDADGDGIPNAIDLLRGAKKTVLNGALYKSSYRPMAYPGGDVPRTEGVCTDVIVRAMRNAGFDLQQLIQEDIKETPQRYPMVTEPDPFIDHRRVRTSLPYFLAHFEALPVDPRERGEPYLPGDICFMNTLGDGEPEHLGIVSDTAGQSGLPLIINNWSSGHQTAEMDLLGSVPVTHRFRLGRRLDPHSKKPLGSFTSGSEALAVSSLLERRGLSVPRKHRQMVLVNTALWSSNRGRLRTYERKNAAWRAAGISVDVHLGRNGLGLGLGLSYGELNTAGSLTTKLEGDGKAPAGVFALGTAFGRSNPASYSGTWPFRSVGDRDRWVDDPHSPQYNTWQSLPTDGASNWRSAERLSIYRLGLVVQHNTERVTKNRGSAIFIHSHLAGPRATAGCTALSMKNMRELLSWLEPESQPVLVQLAGTLN